MIKVKVVKGDINRALKQYKSKVIKTRQMRKLNENKEFEKPSETRRKEVNKAKYVNDTYNKDNY